MSQAQAQAIRRSLKVVNRSVEALGAQYSGLVHGGAEQSRITRKREELQSALDKRAELLNSLSKLK